RACLCRALPVELERIVASNTRAINDLIEWVRTHTRTVVQGIAPDGDAEGWVHKAYEKYHSKKKLVPKGSTKIEEIPKDKVETPIIPRVNNRFNNNACFVCNSNLHQRDSCPHNPQAFRNIQNTGIDPYYGQSANNAPRFPLPVGTSDVSQIQWYEASNRGGQRGYNTPLRSQNYNAGMRGPGPQGDNRQAQRNFNESPFRGNFRGNNANFRGSNYIQNQYPRGNLQGGRPAQNQTGVRTAVPYVEYLVESYDSEEGNYQYYEPNQFDPHSATFPFYPQIEGGYTPEEQYGPVAHDPALATGIQQVREQLSLNQTNITEQIANQSASAQKEREEYSQRLSKLEDNLK
ncbi:MAG: hypothetical protein GY816_15330, partial [Cytophagales bacterium]|nr:hypothetical protein [Cytophagales bacterium]